MAEETNNDGGQPGDGGQGSATSEKTQTGTQITDVAALQKTVDELRAENAKRRNANKELSGKITTLEAEMAERQETPSDGDQALDVEKVIAEATGPLTEKLTAMETQLAEAEKQRVEAETLALHTTIRADFGLPGYARDLVGDDEAALREDAKKLAGEVQAGQPSNALLGATNPALNPKQAALETAQRIYKKQRPGAISSVIDEWSG